jgi:hypothetical protein
MTDDRSLERAARSFIEPGPTQAPDRAVDAALMRIHATNQERDWHVPWRDRPMNQTTRLLAAAAAIAIVLVGGVLLLRPSGSSGVGGTSPAPLASNPTPSGSSAADAALSSYRAARNAICSSAGATLNPLKTHFAGVFDETLTGPQWSDWTNALDQFITGYDDLAARLGALAPPADLVAEHAANVQQLQDMTSLLRSLKAELRSGVPDAPHTGVAHLHAAKGIDEATNPIGQAGFAWETRRGLTHCP